MRAIIQAAHLVRRRLLAALRLRTRGVKVMLFNEDGELLLIRNSYGNTGMFVLPGGGIGRGETPQAAAAREVREEVGMAVHDLRMLGTYQSGAEGKRDTIYLFAATVSGELTTDAAELDEARFFPLLELPENVSPATRRRIAELPTGPAGGPW